MERDTQRETEQAAPAAEETPEYSGPRHGRGPRVFVRITISDLKLINYKNVEFLRQFVTDRGKLRPRRQTGITAAQQRLIAQAVKRARHLALLPFDRDFE
jgi:small subunit ribosomal protein S18